MNWNNTRKLLSLLLALVMVLSIPAMAVHVHAEDASINISQLAPGTTLASGTVVVNDTGKTVYISGTLIENLEFTLKQKGIGVTTVAAGGTYQVPGYGSKKKNQKAATNQFYHDHAFEEESFGVTCTDDGYTQRKCTVCDLTVKEKTAEALGHDYGDAVAAVSHTEKNHVDTKVCVREGCGYQDIQTIEDAVTTNDTTTCTTDGAITVTCSVCGQLSTTEQAAYGHSYKDGYEISAASHTKVATCGHENRVEAHSWTLDDGARCDVCQVIRISRAQNVSKGDVLVNDTNDTLKVQNSGRSILGGGYVLTIGGDNGSSVAPNTTYSVKDQVNSVKNNVLHHHDEVAADAESVIEKTDATCTADGEYSYICSCGEKVTVTIPASHEEVTEVKFDENGHWTEVTCTKCDLNEKRNEAAHKLTAGEDSATCEEPGKKTDTCSGCAYEVTEDTPAKGHSYENGYTITAAEHIKVATCGHGNIAEAHSWTKDGDMRCAVCNVVRLTRIPGGILNNVASLGYGTLILNNTENTVKMNFESIPFVGGLLTINGDDGSEVAPGETFMINGVVWQVTSNLYHGHENKKNGDEGTNVVVEPTCTEKGSYSYICSGCGETQYGDIKALGHTAVSANNAVAPKCEEEGHESDKVCSVCGTITENGDKIEATGHKEVKDNNGVDATCQAPGKTATSHCSVCGELIKTQEDIKRLPHTPVSAGNAVAATCETDGHEDDLKCKVCGEVTQSGAILNKLGHDWKDVEKKDATCTKAGNEAGKICKREGCGATEGLTEIKALGHTEVVDNAVEATCTKDGLTEGKHCSVCKEVLIAQTIVPAAHKVETVPAKEPTCTEDGLSAGGKCSVCGEMVQAGTVIEALGHKEVVDNAVEATCTETGLTEGKHCSVCNEVIVAQETVKANGHTEVVDNAVEATCTKDGLTEGKHCSVCNEVIVAQETVKANGHTEVVDNAVEATCTKDGLTEGKHCSVCEEVLTEQTVVPAAHKVETVPAKEPTCTEDGLSAGGKCSVCGEMVQAGTVINKLGHTEVVDKAVDATCTETGLTEGKHCSVCNEVIVEQETVKANGHTEVVDKAVEATCTETGLTEGKHCSVCGEVTVAQQVTDANGHIDENEDGVCDVCTENLNEEHVHSYRYSGKKSKSGHTVECDCGDSYVESHKVGLNGKCRVCGYAVTNTAKAIQTVQNTIKVVVSILSRIFG